MCRRSRSGSRSAAPAPPWRLPFRTPGACTADRCSPLALIGLIGVGWVVEHVPQVEVWLGEVAAPVIDQLQLVPFGDADAVVAEFEYLRAGKADHQRQMGRSI